MEKEIKLPAISEGEEAGLVNEVYVKDGDHVEAEQSIVAVESDKATVDVPVEESGTVVSVKVKEGDEVKPGDLLVILETNGEATQQEEEPEEQEGNDEQKSQKTDSAEKESEKAEPEEEENKNEKERKLETSSSDKDVAAAPLARKFARKLGIDIQSLKESPDDRVTREDVLAYAKELIKRKKHSGNGKSELKEDEFELPDFSKWGETTRKPMSGVRRETAKTTTRSWKTIPHVTHFDKADVTELDKFLKRYNEKKEAKVTVTSMVLKVIGEALQEFPRFNASLDMAEKEVVFKEYYHVGVAVDTFNGLLLPVVRDVNKKSVSVLSRELNDMASQARDGQLGAEDMKGGNFVISNLGGIGGTSFTPVIFPPHTAILGISRSEMEPVYSEGDFEPRLMLPLSLSYDHRIIDGADAARFLRWVCNVLEEPINLIME